VVQPNKGEWSKRDVCVCGGEIGKMNVCSNLSKSNTTHKNAEKRGNNFPPRKTILGTVIPNIMSDEDRSIPESKSISHEAREKQHSIREAHSKAFENTDIHGGQKVLTILRDHVWLHVERSNSPNRINRFRRNCPRFGVMLKCIGGCICDSGD
jgi:hypothetical protein